MPPAVRSTIPDARPEAWPAPRSRAELAWRDLADGLGMSWIWTALAVQDIRLRYRGSLLGPFWLTVSTLVMVLAIGVIFPRLFGMSRGDYLPYLAIGLILWQFVSGAITDGCQTFIAAAGTIQQTPMPFSLHAYRAVCRNLIVLAHSVAIIPVFLVLFRVHVGPRVVEVLPALAVLAVNGVWASLLLGMISARYRDVPPIVASFLQVAFFVTPIFWPIDKLGEGRWLVELNPLNAAIDVVRAPLLGAPIAGSSWAILLASTLVGCAGTFLAFARFRSRIAYWV
jgi:ABC-type polysaccharide/polyol phosphate export permease